MKALNFRLLFIFMVPVISGNEQFNDIAHVNDVMKSLLKLPVGAENLANEVCLSHLAAYQEKVDKLFLTFNSSDIWALQMYDSSGHIHGGFLELAWSLLGSYSECLDLDVDRAYLENGDTFLEPFRGRFLQGFLLSYDSPQGANLLDKDFVESEFINFVKKHIRNDRSAVISWRPSEGGDIRDLLLIFTVRLGICVPSSCSMDEISRLTNLRLLQIPQFEQTQKKLSMLYLSNMSKADEIPLDWLDGLLIAILVLFTATVLWATLQECFGEKSGMLKYTFLSGFSLLSNGKRLLNTQAPKSGEHLSCLNGIRFMSMTWVLLSHTYGLFQLAIPVNNLTSLPDYFYRYALQALLNGYPSVDSFFFISGLLLSYLTFKELDRTKGKINILMFYIHRYIRLTAVYAIVLLYRVSLYKYAPMGPTNLVDQEISDCKEVLYRQFLYINNIHYNEPENDYKFCMGPSWYLATDMQIFIITPLILFPMWWLSKYYVDYVWPVTCCLISTLVIAIMTHLREWPATPSFDNADGSDYFYRNYYMPWTRFQPYGVGIILGYILNKYRGQKIKISSFMVFWGWVLAFATGFCVIYSLNIPEHKRNGDVPGEAVNIIYGSLHRLGWGLALAWMVFACVKGYGGIINTFLCWEAFAPLARLTYVMYLIHDVFLSFVPSWIMFESTFNHLLATFIILCVLVLTMSVAIPVVLVLEMPLLHMEKYLFGKILGVGQKKEGEKNKH